MPIFLIWTVAEILIFAAFADHFGFLVTLVGYCLPTILGISLLSHFRIQGLAALQSNLSQGNEPTQEILRAAAKALGAILLLPPSFILRVAGLLLVTPGISHLLMFLLKVTLLRRLMTFGSGFVRAGSAGFAFYSGTRNSNKKWVNLDGLEGDESGWDRSQNSRVRDVEAIDVTPISIDHRKTPAKGHRGDRES